MNDLAVTNGKNCLMCPAKFKKNFQLARHRKVEHLFGKFPCITCDKIFKNGNNYLEHVKSNHVSTEVLVCIVCDKCLPLNSWVEHLKECYKNGNRPQKKEKEKKVVKNDKEVITCRYCPKEFPNLYKRNQHQRRDHHGLAGYDCLVCAKTFSAFASRKIHMETEHEFGNFCCPLCGEKFKFVPDFFAHIKTFHVEMLAAPCDSCEAEILLDEYSKHRVSCHLKRIVELRKKLREKVKASQGLKCRFCDLLLPDYARRMSHENEKHTGRQYQCPLCEFQTHSSLKLGWHKKKFHDKEDNKTFCPICGKQLSKGQIKEHISYVHEGKKDNAKCNDCGEVFERQSHLLKHRNLVHSTNPKFDCDVCGRRCSSLANKEDHMLIHSEGTFACEICGKVLKRKKNLIMHMRLHTGEKPFQ